MVFWVMKKLNIEQYWLYSPPELSDNCKIWIDKINKGFIPNRRISRLGYYCSAEFYNVYIWEYLNIISPLLNSKR